MSLRVNIERFLKRDVKKGIISTIILSPLYLISLLYGAVVRIRFLLYKSSIFPSNRLPCKVVSIGNISTGGTGKTPMTLYLSKVMGKMGYRVAVLSRGYKSKREKAVTILSDGESLFFGPEECGDEPCLIASKLKGIPVLTGRDRYLSGKLAWEKFKVDMVILDDGFQHLRLKRDIDIVLVTPDILNGKNYLLPRGHLREPLQAIERADIVMVRDGDKEFNFPFDKPVFTFRYKPVSLINLREERKEGIGSIKGKTVLALCGIASPDAFFTTLDGLGAIISERLIYADHYHYTPQDIRKIEEVSKGVDMVVTTEKDGINLQGIIPEGLNIYALEIEVEVMEEERFINAIKGLL
ncbi:MAG: tetraacyldisaccharide 4'-kinase [Thermodesulfobacteriota bacterium]